VSKKFTTVDQYLSISRK